MSMIHCLALQTSLLVWKDVCICMLFWLFHLRTKSSDGIISRPLGHILVDRRQYFMCNRMNNRAWLLYFEQQDLHPIKVSSIHYHESSFEFCSRCIRAFDVFKLNNDKQFQGTNATAIQKSTFYVKLIDWLQTISFMYH